MTAMACTLWVPVRNVKNFILLKPPAVVFAFCVASFAVITFSLALHIKHTGYHLRNPDKMVPYVSLEDCPCISTYIFSCQELE